MDVFLKFVCDHSHVIIESVLTIIVLFVTIFKKKVKINDVFQSVLMVLPEYISLAEKEFKDGSEKYSFVFGKCVQLLMNLTHLSSSKVLDQYTAMIDSAIENILTTPQKKGGK